MRRRVSGWLCAALLAAPAAQAAEYEGRLDWARQVPLGTLASGVVEQVTVEAGDRVRRGQLLAHLDQRALVADVRRAQAQVDYLRSAFEEATREQERVQELYDRTLVADHDLQLAQIARVKAEAGLRGAEAELTEVQLLLDYSAVRAPFDGVVLRRDAEPGQVVVTRLASVTLLTLAASGELVARFALPAAEHGSLEPGRRANVQVDGQTYAGRVRPSADPAVGEVVFTLPAKATLAVGRRVQVVLP
jgi:multidrug efflux system membrane fusion protein